MTAVTLQLPANLKLTDEEFTAVVAANKDLRLELSPEFVLNLPLIWG
jgi:hypothetical protein